jgi:hypothetical protein
MARTSINTISMVYFGAGCNKYLDGFYKLWMFMIQLWWFVDRFNKMLHFLPAHDDCKNCIWKIHCCNKAHQTSSVFCPVFTFPVDHSVLLRGIKPHLALKGHSGDWQMFGHHCDPPPLEQLRIKSQNVQKLQSTSKNLTPVDIIR